MAVYAEDEFQKWLDEEWLYDVSGGDWDDLVNAVRLAFYEGWNKRYETLTTKDI